MRNRLSKITFVAVLLTAVYGHASTPPTIVCPDLAGKTVGDVFGETLPPMNKPAKDVALPGLSGWLFSGFVTPSVFKPTNTFQLIGHAANTRCNYYVVENGGHKGSVAFTQDPNAAPSAEAQPEGEKPAEAGAEAKPEDEKPADAAAGAKPEDEKPADAAAGAKPEEEKPTDAAAGAKPEEEKPTDAAKGKHDVSEK